MCKPTNFSLCLKFLSDRPLHQILQRFSYSCSTLTSIRNKYNIMVEKIIEETENYDTGAYYSDCLSVCMCVHVDMFAKNRTDRFFFSSLPEFESSLFCLCVVVFFPVIFRREMVNTPLFIVDRPVKYDGHVRRTNQPPAFVRCVTSRINENICNLCFRQTATKSNVNAKRYAV